MKKFISFLILALTLPLVVSAQPSGPVSVSGNHVTMSAPNATPSSVNINVPNALGSYNIYTANTKRFSISGAGLITKESGAVEADAVVVPVMAATPVAVTNSYSGLVNAVATAAANTSAFLPTPLAAGITRTIINFPNANAIRISAGGTNTINGGSAGGYIPLAAAAIARCTSLSTSAWHCGALAIPTPAGP